MTAARAVAERDTLLELIAIATHDINNPLQSLVVLLELALDEAHPESDAYVRAQQCLMAGERIRALSSALAGLGRSRPQDAAAAWGRVHGLLSRRFDRFGIHVGADLSRLDRRPFPVELELPLLGACMLVIATAAAGARGVRMALSGEPDPLRLSLAVEAAEPLAWEPVALARLGALANDTVRIEIAAEQVTLRAGGGA